MSKELRAAEGQATNTQIWSNTKCGHLTEHHDMMDIEQQTNEDMQRTTTHVEASYKPLNPLAKKNNSRMGIVDLPRSIKQWRACGDNRKTEHM